MCLRGCGRRDSGFARNARQPARLARNSGLRHLCPGAAISAQGAACAVDKRLALPAVSIAQGRDSVTAHERLHQSCRPHKPAPCVGCEQKTLVLRELHVARTESHIVRFGRSLRQQRVCGRHIEAR
eukprot:6596584-Prymnesium_polylepis.1